MRLPFASLALALLGGCCFEWSSPPPPPPPRLPVVVDAGVPWGPTTPSGKRVDALLKKLEKGSREIDALLDAGP
ncbi:MAG: hypothetical protein JNM17_10320, partial [Archangium sp.]|nr:hypothetical protein [Archangium sp.]